MRSVPGHKDELAGTDLELLLGDLELEGAFEDEKRLVVIVPMERSPLPRRDTPFEEREGSAGILGKGEKRDDRARNLDRLPLYSDGRLHGSALPFSECPGVR